MYFDDAQFHTLPWCFAMQFANLHAGTSFQELCLLLIAHVPSQWHGVGIACLSEFSLRVIVVYFLVWHEIA